MRKFLLFFFSFRAFIIIIIFLLLFLVSLCVLSFEGGKEVIHPGIEEKHAWKKKQKVQRWECANVPVEAQEGHWGRRKKQRGKDKEVMRPDSEHKANTCWSWMLF